MTPEVLAWAINDVGLNEERVAVALDVSLKTVRSWLLGTDQPLTGEFRKLAKLVNRPPSFLLQSEVRAPSGAPAKFRRHATSGEREPLTAEEVKALRTARRLQAVVRSVREQREDRAELDLPTFTTHQKSAGAAAALRRYLRWKTTEQFQAKTASRAFSLLRDRVEEVGFLVMLLPLKRAGCRGFALVDDTAPLATVNSAQTFEARTFTLMHEVAHIVLGEDSFDAGYEVTTNRERWCEEFAAAFLLPEPELRRFVETTFNRPVIDLTEASRVATRFRVSLTATCIRLENLELGPSGGLVHRIPHHDYLKSEGTGFNPDPSTEAKRLREYGPAIVSEIIDAEDAGRLRRHDVQRYLHVTDEKYAALASRLQEATGNLAVLDEEL